MGTLVNCPEAGLIRNGQFETSEFWGIDNFWQIHDQVADCSWPLNGVDINLYQYTTTVLWERYIIDLDILEIDAPVGAGLRIRLGRGGSVTSVLKATVGHHRTVLPNNLGDDYLLLFITGSAAGPGYIKIDNVAMSSLETFIACAMNFLNLTYTKFEWYDLGGGIYMVMYANHNGGSSCWFKFDINDF